MKIDEAINFVENMMYLYRPTGEQHDKWCELLNLLRWYREQDLIRREDVKNDEVLKEIALGFEREFLKTVMMIPKAEPPKEEE